MRKICLFTLAMLVGAAASGAAQTERSLKGTVTDVETGQPIASASVHVKGTSIGAYSANDGRFTINAAPAGALTLEVRRIGYAPQNVTVAEDQNQVDIKLKADVLRLSQQVVTGQATYVARRNLANDIATVGTEDLNRTGTASLENALQGKDRKSVV